jgi:glutamyl-tRNA synthetase
MASPVRVRFAPAPTGLMHIGNVRTALLNYLYAQRYQGTFILRVEDTDRERNVDPQATQIIEQLQWLGLQFTEGPYFQSQRDDLYQEKLQELIGNGSVYQCFCTSQELETKRQRQIMLKLPPRYDRTCFRLSDQERTEKALSSPYIWRLKVMEDRTITIQDLAHGTITFNLKEIADIPLTRTDGSFTFIFANAVDDIVMQISHVIRGEDHLTNTAVQVVLYDKFKVKLPTYWHLPILCSVDGKKLSKRDFGFSLVDLRNAGYLPEAIDNYLGLIGGGTFAQEILSISELAKEFNFETMHATGQIKYDVQKLRWVNHQWISKLTVEDLALRCKPFLIAAHPQAAHLDTATLHKLIAAIRTDLVTLGDCATLLNFYFNPPAVTTKDLHTIVGPEHVQAVRNMIVQHLSEIDNVEQFLKSVKQAAQTQGIGKEIFWALRMLLTGSAEGIGTKELLTLLGSATSKARIAQALEKES